MVVVPQTERAQLLLMTLEKLQLHHLSLRVSTAEHVMDQHLPSQTHPPAFSTVNATHFSFLDLQLNNSQ